MSTEPIEYEVTAVEQDAHFALSDGNITSALSGELMNGFEGLYRAHYRRVYSICLRMTANIAEAEDLTQEVFIQLYRKLRSFRGEAAFTTWLHRLTVNQVLMHFRKRSVKDELTNEDGEFPEQADINSCSMPIVDRLILEQAIDQLPAGYRQVFVLHDVEGYKHTEIAELLDCSTGASKSQLHKAKLALRGKLNSRFGQAPPEVFEEVPFEGVELPAMDLKQLLQTADDVAAFEELELEA